jgi:hypothetical protein
MPDLTLEPYELRQGDLIQVRAYALNTNGWSEPSEFNAGEVKVNAALPQTISERPTLERLSESEIEITWNSIFDEPIAESEAYEIALDPGFGSFEI